MCRNMGNPRQPAIPKTATGTIHKSYNRSMALLFILSIPCHLLLSIHRPMHRSLFVNPIQSNPIPAVIPATLMLIVPESQQAASIHGSNPNNNNGNGFSSGHVLSVGASNNDSSSVSSSTTTTTRTTSLLRLCIPAPASQHKATPWTNDLCIATPESTVTTSRLQTQAQNHDTTYSYCPPRHVCSNPVSLQKRAKHFGNLPL